MIIERIREPESWAYYAPMIKRALAEAPFPESLGTVMAKLWGGDAEMVSVVYEDKVVACAVMELAEFHGAPALHVWALSGDHMDLWVDDLVVFLNEWALEMGCEYVSLGGRRGWERYLKPHDYKVTDVILAQKVTA